MTCPGPIGLRRGGVVRRWSRSPAALVGVGLLAAGLAMPLSEVEAQATRLDRVLSELEPEIQRALVAGRIPSVAIALVVGDRVLAGGYGYSNLWARTPATPSTVYHFASTFKTISTFALLQQMEQGKFRLGDPVGPHLRGFAIQGEDPRNPVTFRHLLTHRSGLPAFAGEGNVWVWADSAPPSLRDYLAARLRVVGPPMDSVRYSNMAFALVGHLVGELSGIPYRQYIEERVWGELEMTSTGFAPTPDMEQRLAVPYAIDERTGSLIPVRRMKSPRYPAGFVYGTVEDMARWLIFNLGDGEYRGKRLLSRETMELMHTQQYGPNGQTTGGGNESSGYGLAWTITHANGKRYFSHSGSIHGYTGYLTGKRDERIGVAILANGDQQHQQLIRLANLAMRLLESEVEQERTP